MARKRKEATPHLRIRIEPELLSRLEKSRTANTRTLTGEIVHRIEQTFRKSDDAELATLVYRAAFGGPTGDLLRAFATAIWLLEKRTGKKWNEDLETAAKVQHALFAIVGAFVRPLDAETAFHFFKEIRTPWRFGKEGIDISTPAAAVALEALQKMGLAPSDEDIARAAKKHDDAKAEGERQ